LKTIVFILLIFISALTYAQEIDSTKVLEEVTISINRNPSKKREVPNQVQLITAKEIAKQQVQTTADLLHNSGMVSVQKSQAGGGSPILRGLEASRVLLMIDGVRINNLIFRSGHLQNIISYDQHSLDRIEVIYGPTSTQYGSDALGGVVALFSKSPVFKNEGKKIVFGSSGARFSSANNEKTINASIGISQKKWASFSAFTFSDFGDVRQGKTGNKYKDLWLKNVYVDRIDEVDKVLDNPNPYIQNGSAYSQINALQKISFAPNSNTLHTLNFQYTTSSNINRYDRLSEFSRAMPTFSEWYYGPQKWGLASYKLEKFLNKPLIDKFEAIFSYQYFNESRHNRRFGNNFLNSRNEEVDSYNYTIFGTKKINKNKFTAGFDGYFNVLKSTAFKTNIQTNERSALDTRYPNGRNTMQSHALFASHNYKLNNKWLFSDGLRLTFTQLYAQFKDKTFFPLPYDSYTNTNLALCGNAGIIYLPTDKLKFSLNYANGFRTPNTDDLSKVFESTQGIVIVPNPNIAPERTNNLDLGFNAQIFKKLNVENYVFVTHFSNAIVLEPSTFNGTDSILYDGVMSKVFTNKNNRNAFIYGNSTVLNYRLSSFWKMYGMATYTVGRITENKFLSPLDHIPPVFGKVGVAFSPNKFTIDAFALFNGTKKIADYKLNGEDNEQYATPIGMPTWYTLNLKVTYTLQSLIFSGGIENILDRNYRTFSSGISAPGRNIYASINYGF
jgi:hemoglobin/transferrin/lactoferrin receptor protein